jgi:hypothetical protein
MILMTFGNNDKNIRTLTTVVSLQWSIRWFRRFSYLALPRSKFGKRKKAQWKVFQRFQIYFQIIFTMTRFSSSPTPSLTIFSIHDEIKKNWSRDWPQILSLPLIFDAEHYTIICYSKFENFLMRVLPIFEINQCNKSLRSSLRFFEGVFHVIWVLLQKKTCSTNIQ